MRLNQLTTHSMPVYVISKYVLACLALFWPMLAGVNHVHAEAGLVHIAVIEPQVTAADDQQSSALVMTLDHLLTTSLAQRKDVTLVDRQSLHAVLAERELALTGAVDNVAASKADESLKPFFAAGLLVVSQIDPKVRSVTVEVIVAQNGMRVASLQWQLKQLDEPSMAKMVEVKMPDLWDQALKALHDVKGQKTIEVTASMGQGRARLRWLADDAAESARAKVALIPQVALLTPRRPLVTKEERLLRVAGLAASEPNDAAATLRATPDMLVELSVSEKDAMGKQFRQTPVTLHAQIRLRQNDLTLTKDFNGLVGEWDKVIDAMDIWLGASLAKLHVSAAEHVAGDTSANQDDDERAREMAAAAMASIEPWTQLRIWNFFELPVALRLRLCEIAQRASHLDPANETAAWLVVVTMLADQEARELKDQDESYHRRVLLETQRYRERFGDQNQPRFRDVYMRLVHVCAGRQWHLQHKDDPAYLAEHGHKSAFLEPPDLLQYEVARPYVRAIADWGARSLTDKRYAVGNTHVVFTYSLITQLIPHIPESELQSEYAWWEHFYATRIDVLPENKRPNRHGGQVAAPWELAQAAFAARRRDPQAVRRYLQIVAERYPENISSVWGSKKDTRNPLKVPIFLKVAGDPQWETWQPRFGPSQALQVSLDDMTAMMRSARAQVPPVWDNAKVLPLQGLKLNIPEAVRDASQNSNSTTSLSVEAVLQTDDTIWLTTPGITPGSPGVPVSLFVADLGEEHDQSIDVQTAAIDWPNINSPKHRPSVTYAHAVKDDSGSVVFIGTEKHGLLRVEKIKGQWISRWIRTRDGLPSNSIQRLATCVHQGRQALLVMTSDQIMVHGMGNVKTTTSVLDIRSNDVKLLHEDSTSNRGSVAVMKDGSQVLVTLAGSGAYARPFIVEEIDFFKKHDLGWEFKETPRPYTLADGPGLPMRIWKPVWDHVNRTYHVYEYDGRSLKRTNGKSPGRSVTKGISVAVNEHAKDVISPIVTWPGGDATMKIHTWPSMDVVYSTGGGPILWLTLNTHTGWDRSNLIVGYRPAPLESKDWAADDQWVGPFRTPNHQLITGFRQAQKPGQFLLSTITDVMLLDENELVSYARQHDALQSTRQWRTQYLGRLSKAGWQCQVPALMLDKKHEQALDVLDALLSDKDDASPDDNAPTTDRFIILLWKARVLADLPARLSDAISLYDTIATAKDVSPAMEVFARGNQIVLLYRAKRWQTIIELGTRMHQRFPQLTAETGTRSLSWYITQSKKQIQDETSASSPLVPAQIGHD